MTRIIRRKPQADLSSYQDTLLLKAAKQGSAPLPLRLREHAPSSIDEWADRIKPHLIKAVQSMIDAGKELLRAKEALPHGKFIPLLEELNLSEPMAWRFMEVARRFSKSSPVKDLPPAISVLVELTKLDDDEIDDAVQSGEINSSMTRKQAIDLRKRIKGRFGVPTFKQAKHGICIRDNVINYTGRYRSIVIDVKKGKVPEDDIDELRQLHAELGALLDRY